MVIFVRTFAGVVLKKMCYDIEKDVFWFKLARLGLFLAYTANANYVNEQKAEKANKNKLDINLRMTLYH